MKTLLVVDDDPVFAGALQRVLEAEGYAIHCALDTAAALAMVAAITPEYVIVDLNLGKESGLRLIESVRSALPAARIVVVTGYASIATAVFAMRLGADDYLPKPVDRGSLLKVLAGGAADVGNTHQIWSPKRLEWEHIQRALVEHDGNISATARALGMHRRTLQRKLSKRPVRR